MDEGLPLLLLSRILSVEQPANPQPRRMWVEAADWAGVASQGQPGLPTGRKSVHGRGQEIV